MVSSLRSADFFRPLFEVTKDPSSHPKLDIFLQQVVGFDSVDDESKHSRGFHHRFTVAFPSFCESSLDVCHFSSSLLPWPACAHSLWEPEKWNYGGNPPYAYYCFYWYANIFTLNQWRKSKNMSSGLFRFACWGTLLGTPPYVHPTFAVRTSWVLFCDRYLCLPSSLWRGWRPGPSDMWIPFRGLHQPWNPLGGVSSAAVPVRFPFPLP